MNITRVSAWDKTSCVLQIIAKKLTQIHFITRSSLISRNPTFFKQNYSQFKTQASN